MVRKTLLEGTIVAIAGLALGVGAWRLTGQVGVALSVCAFGTALLFCWLRRRDDRRLREADGLAAHLAAERGQHHATQKFIQSLLDVVPMPIYVKDANSRVIIVNRAQAEQWGQASDTVIGAQSVNLTPDPELSLAEDKRVLGGELIDKEEHTLDGYRGQEQFRVITKGRCVDTAGNYAIVCASFDTTRWRQAERDVQQTLEREKLLRQRNQEFIQRAIDVIPDPFYIKDRNGRLVMVNEAYARARERTRESLIGMLSTAVEITPQLAADTTSEDEAVLCGQIIDKEQHYVVPQTGEERFRLVSKRPCTDMDGLPIIVVAHIDITRWKVAERKLERIAHQDELTSLPNRRHFLQEAERLISLTTRHVHPLSLIIFDIDHFKLVNDQHGHGAGDQVLKEVAARLMVQMRSEDLPCRWGGEEFVVLLPMTDLATAVFVAERMREAFANEPIVQELNLTVTISGGITQKLVNETLSECIARADKALYAAKNSGRNLFLPA